ncbi:MAG: DUF6701 domain-containing protein [Shewanella sp.]
MGCRPLLLLVLISFISASVCLDVYAFGEIDESVYFPSVAQGHHGNNNNSCHGVNDPQFKQTDSVRINGTLGDDLAFCTTNNLTDGLPTDGCDTASEGDRYCTVTGSDFRGVPTNGNNAFKLSDEAGGEIVECADGDEFILGDDSDSQFGKISVDSACTVTFSADYTEYRVKNILAGGGATIVFMSGDYFVEELKLSQNSHLIAHGDVRIFVKSGIEIDSGSINESGSGHVLLFGYDSIKLSSATVIKANIYSDGDIYMNDSSTVYGRVTSRYLEMNNQSVINDANFAAPSLNHYRIEFSSGALSCTSKDITIKACADDDCTSEFNDIASVELTKDGVVYSNNEFLGSTSASLWHTSGGTVTVGLGSTLPLGGYFCYINGIEVANTNCILDYADAGFIVDIPNELSNKVQQDLEITAVKINEADLLCVPTFQGVSKSLNFWSDYISPGGADRPASLPVFIDDIAIGQSALAATPVILAFDNVGKATFKLNYADAGRLELKINYTAVTGDEDEGLEMEGSDTFVRYPVGLCLSPEARCEDADDYKDCDGFKKAGETFELSIQAMAWQSDSDLDFCDNLPTANYVQSNISLSAKLIAPADGSNGTTGLLAYKHTAQSDSINLLFQSIDEVGVFTFTATPPLDGYLGEAITIPAAESEPVGRFYPSDFKVYDYGIMPACMAGLYSYMDEPFRLNLSVRARNVAGNTTENYYDDFASGSAFLVAENNGNGIDLQSRISGFPSLVWSKSDLGVQNIDDDILFSRQHDGLADGPYSLLDIGLRILDDDGVSVDGTDMNAATGDICGASNSCNAKRLSSQHLRHGRIVMQNAYGPETDTLRMPITAEYWNGTQWRVNTLDECTDIISAILPTTGVDYDPALATGQTVTRSGGTPFSEGRFELLWQSLIATPHRYRGQVTAPLAVQNWLQWNWNWNGEIESNGALSDPRASALFGHYRGHDKVIYWREVE